jgi:hypothetical protein
MEIVLLLKVKISRKLLHENVVKLSDLYEIYRDTLAITTLMRLNIKLDMITNILRVRVQ